MSSIHPDIKHVSKIPYPTVYVKWGGGWGHNNQMWIEWPNPLIPLFMLTWAFFFKTVKNIVNRNETHEQKKCNIVVMETLTLGHWLYQNWGTKKKESFLSHCLFYTLVNKNYKTLHFSLLMSSSIKTMFRHHHFVCRQFLDNWRTALLQMCYNRCTHISKMCVFFKLLTMKCNWGVIVCLTAWNCR